MAFMTMISVQALYILYIKGKGQFSNIVFLVLLGNKQELVTHYMLDFDAFEFNLSDFEDCVDY